MTEKRNYTYITPGNGKLKITREKSHRYYAGEIYESDFCTGYHSEGQSVNRVAQSIKWTIRNEERRTNK